MLGTVMSVDRTMIRPLLVRSSGTPWARSFSNFSKSAGLSPTKMWLMSPMMMLSPRFLASELSLPVAGGVTEAARLTKLRAASVTTVWESLRVASW